MPEPVSAYLCLGSNEGDRLRNLRRACAALQERGIVIRRASSVYETEPVDLREQAWFLNAVIEVETSLPPLDLLDKLQQTERELGRKRTVPKGPRTIDLDILLYGNAIIREERLTVPHPALGKRRFVLVPLREIAPTLKLPFFDRTPEELVRELQDSSDVNRISEPLFAADPSSH
jgi:2-amino-4-hydroxy-6-hydroxymethyldihydropteridine diphosphokinase